MFGERSSDAARASLSSRARLSGSAFSSAAGTSARPNGRGGHLRRDTLRPCRRRQGARRCGSAERSIPINVSTGCFELSGLLARRETDATFPDQLRRAQPQARTFQRYGPRLTFQPWQGLSLRRMTAFVRSGRRYPDRLLLAFSVSRTPRRAQTRSAGPARSRGHAASRRGT